jgi:hypothetical protein
VKQCLECIGVTKEHFEGATTLEEEFGIIKRVYHRLVLKVHPDKGGDAAVFRDVNTSFESLKDLFTEKRVDTFIDSINPPTCLAPQNPVLISRNGWMT